MEVIARYRLNELGRITIPQVIRHELDLSPGDVIEIGLDDNGDIVMHRQINQCVFCKSVFDFDELTLFKGQYICKACSQQFKRNQKNE